MAIKTVPTHQAVQDFINTLDDLEQRADSEELVEMMGDISGQPAIMWGTAIIGFGTQRYKYASGREGDWMKIGFSPRKGKLSLYITYDAQNFTKELADMGKHQTGKGCIYIKRLADVDKQKLKAIIRTAYARAGDFSANT